MQDDGEAVGSGKLLFITGRGHEKLLMNEHMERVWYLGKGPVSGPKNEEEPPSPSGSLSFGFSPF